MSVLIKGMDMPKECVKAEIYKDKDDKWVLAVKDKEYYTSTGFAEESTLYELAEVPTPHGRLIDTDAIDYDDYGKQGFTNRERVVSRIINAEQPTVIEAENERNEMMNIADTIKGEINRMCVTKEQTEFDSMCLHVRKNIEKLAWLIYNARFKKGDKRNERMV